MSKELCKCGSLAVWDYLPGNSYYCDNCVPRGCSCNYHHNELPDIEDYPFKWVDDNTWVRVDEQGREYPCVEYDYDCDGFDNTEEE
jgi:hypothetical protein